MSKLTSKHVLGKSGLEVAPVIFGTSCLGNLYQAIADDVKLSIEREWFEHVEEAYNNSVDYFNREE